MMTNHLMDGASGIKFAHVHPILQQFITEGIKHADFFIIQSTRTRAEQEQAFARHTTKAHFGDSAHDYSPSVAVDLGPFPLDYSNTEAFLKLQSVLGWYNAQTKVGVGLAKTMAIPIRWGGNWDMTIGGHSKTLVDLPHYELNPWRRYAR